jgi:hypothetical protein
MKGTEQARQNLLNITRRTWSRETCSEEGHHARTHTHTRSHAFPAHMLTHMHKVIKEDMPKSVGKLVKRFF